MISFKDYSNIMVVNNTGRDLRMFEPAIKDSIANNKPLPEEIADLFTLTVVKAGDKIRGIIDWQ